MSARGYHEFRSHRLNKVGIDADAGVIHGVSVIEGGVVAEGHNLLVDDIALAQFFTQAKKKGKVPVKVNHKSGVSELAGYLINPRVDGKHLRADWHLLRNNKDFALVMEAAERMPECFGLSTAFRGVPEIVDGQPRARCELLKSVDVVVDPAANSTGLFSARVDSMDKANGDDQMTTEFETLLDAIQQNTATLNEFSGRLEGVEGNLTEFADALADTAEGLEEIDLDDLTDEQIADLVDEGLLDPAILDELDGYEDDDDDLAPEGAEFSATDAHVAHLEAKIDQLVNYIARKERAEIASHENTAFSALEAKVGHMAERLQSAEAERDALRSAINGSGHHVAFDTERGNYQLTTSRGSSHHEFQALVEQACASDPRTPKDVHFKALMDRHQELYMDWRASMGVGSTN